MVLRKLLLLCIVDVNNETYNLGITRILIKVIKIKENTLGVADKDVLG